MKCKFTISMLIIFAFMFLLLHSSINIYGDPVESISTRHWVVEINGFAFNPNSLIINPGDNVTWFNNDSAPHTITADSSSFNSGTISIGSNWSYIFTTPGSYPYHCSIHTTMHGLVTVNSTVSEIGLPIILTYSIILSVFVFIVNRWKK